MRPASHEPREAWGVLNPAAARGRDGQLYLLPRIVAEGNFSRIALARVQFSDDGNPIGVQRLSIVLEPREPYELAPRGLGGCEDPRVTYVPALDRYIMVYAALSNLGPRVAMALSYDLFYWQRLGICHFAHEDDVDWNDFSDKDGMLFPEPVQGPDGRPALALLHRPTCLVCRTDGTIDRMTPPGQTDHRESTWISYVSLDAVRRDIRNLTHFSHHHFVAAPQADWESVKIGGGTPPLLTHLGWLLIYHGVSGTLHPVTPEEPVQKQLKYSAGAMVLDRLDPRKVLYRSSEPILQPEAQEELEGIVANVVFPTGIDPRARPVGGARVDVYYGMADDAIGAGWFVLPQSLPS
jgi:predicted GH43/DUF377 family glycosyl hydrolase